MQDNTTTTENNPLDKIEDIKILPGRPDLPSGKTDTDKSGETKGGTEKDLDANNNQEEEEEENTNQEDQEEEKEQGEEQEESEGEEQNVDDSDDNETTVELTEEDVDGLVSERFGISASEIEQRLKRLDELEKNGVAPKFQSEKHQKAYEFISKYSGNDFGDAIVRFSKLQSLDIEKLDSKQAMQELFYQKHPQLSREKADKMFEYEFNQRYSAIDDEDIAQTKQDLEGDQAKQELAALQKETHSTQTDTANQQNAEWMEHYLEGVDQVLSDFDQLTLSIDGEPDFDFNFEIENKDLIRDSMAGVENLYRNNGWLDSKGNFDLEKMKVDLAFLHSKEKLLASYMGRGIDIGKEMILREKSNMTPKKRDPNYPVKGGPRTSEEAMDAAILNHPRLKGN